MDGVYYAYYERKTQTEEMFHDFLEKWVYGVKDRKEYLTLLEAKRLEKLRPDPFSHAPDSYGKLSHHFEV